MVEKFTNFVGSEADMERMLDAIARPFGEVAVDAALDWAEAREEPVPSAMLADMMARAAAYLLYQAAYLAALDGRPAEEIMPLPETHEAARNAWNGLLEAIRKQGAERMRGINGVV